MIVRLHKKFAVPLVKRRMKSYIIFSVYFKECTSDYFYGQSGELFSFYRIPKALFRDSRFQQLSTDAKTLYGILLDRMSLSAKNNWLDKQGRVFIIYTVQEVQDSLPWMRSSYSQRSHMSSLAEAPIKVMPYLPDAAILQTQ